MAIVNKVELNLSRKVANPFKTTRKSTTNPFKFSDFEGNTLDASVYADVFDGNSKKLKMISTTVIGTLTKIRSSITEPIARFVNRVKTGITNAWDYAKNTNVEIAALKNISDKINNVMNYDIGKGITDSITGIRKNISENFSFLNKDIKDIGADIISSCTSLIGKDSKKISADMTVNELKDLWKKEIEEAAHTTKDVALDTSSVLKEVA